MLILLCGLFLFAAPACADTPDPKEVFPAACEPRGIELHEMKAFADQLEVAVIFWQVHDTMEPTFMWANQSAEGVTGQPWPPLPGETFSALVPGGPEGTRRFGTLMRDVIFAQEPIAIETTYHRGEVYEVVLYPVSAHVVAMASARTGETAPTNTSTVPDREYLLLQFEAAERAARSLGAKAEEITGSATSSVPPDNL